MHRIPTSATLIKAREPASASPGSCDQASHWGYVRRSEAERNMQQILSAPNLLSIGADTNQGSSLLSRDFDGDGARCRTMMVHFGDTSGITFDRYKSLRHHEVNCR